MPITLDIPLSDAMKHYRTNPPKEWHRSRLVLGRQSYLYAQERKDVYSIQYWKGYFNAHKAFVKIEKSGQEPVYDGYIRDFDRKYDAEISKYRQHKGTKLGKQHRIRAMFFLGVVNAARESALRMRVGSYVRK